VGVIMKKRIKKMMVYSGFFITLASSTKIYKTNTDFEVNINNHIENDEHCDNIVAHRGLSSLYVENSKEAILNAFELDCVSKIEIDVRLTKDNQIVVIHNSGINLNSDGTGKVEDKTLSELKEYYFHQDKMDTITYLTSFITIPDGKFIRDRYIQNEQNISKIVLLDEILSEINIDKELIIDMKFNDDKDLFIDELNKIISKYDINYLIQSSNYDDLFYMKEKYPNYNYQLIIKEKDNLKYLDSEFNSFAIKKNLVNNKIIEEQLNKKNNIMVWTINNYVDYENLKEKLGENLNEIDIITNYPDEICYLNTQKDDVKVLVKK
jgi:glycerophosphoryl diester phosphodiesterase